MAIKSDPNALKRLRESVYKEKQKNKQENKQEYRTSDSNALNRLREAVRKDKQNVTIGFNNADTSVTKKEPPKFATETANAFKTAKGNATKITTITSGLTDDERKKRINEINSELSEISIALSGLSRAEVYGSSDYITKSRNDYQTRYAELEKELDTLKRTGTFTGSEQLDFQIEDANEKVARLSSELAQYGSRPSKTVVEEYQYDSKELNEAKAELENLKREKGLYTDITKYGDVINKDNFWGQSKANYRNAELSREADKAFNLYLDNPTEENRQIAYAYDALVRQYAENNENALDNEGEVLPWLSKSAAGYLPQFIDQLAPELIGAGVGGLLGYAVGLPTVGASAGAGLATGFQSYGVMRGSVYRALLAEGIDEETALEAANDEALISSIIEGGESAVSWLLAGGGKALSAIGKAATTAVGKGSTNAATKFIANMATKAATKGATKAVTKAATTAARPLWKTALHAGAGIVGNAVSEYGEEFLQEGVSLANKDRTLNGDKDDSLLLGTGKVIGQAITGKNDEALEQMHEAGKEGFKIGLMFGGTNAVVNNVVAHYANAKTDQMKNDVADAVIEDDESLTALIDEGKASGGVAEKVAKEVETAKENGKVTRSQVKRLIETNEVYIKNEEQTASNTEPDTLEKAAMDVVAQRNEQTQPKPQKISNEAVASPEIDSTPIQEQKSVKSPLETAEAKANEAAFEAGRKNVPRENLTFETQEQENAYNAGRVEHIKNMNSDNSTQNNIENSDNVEYNGNEKKTVRTKKSDWTATDVEYTIPDKKKPIAYSTRATSDLIETLSDDNPTATISELKDLVNYDVEAKKVLQQYIDAGYGNKTASEFFSRKKANTTSFDFDNEIDGAIKKGTGFVGGKNRIVEFYQNNPSKAEAIEFLKKEYGQGGGTHYFADGSRGYISTDSKGFKIEKNGESKVYSWGEVDKHIRNLVESGTYTDDNHKASSSISNEDSKYVSPQYETTEARKPIEATNMQADKKRRADAATQYGLSTDEARRLGNYVGGPMCYILNDRMINGTLTSGDLTVINDISNALLKMPEYSGRTYRNLRFRTETDYNNFLNEYAEGKSVELKAFTSTSKLPNGYPLFGNNVVHLVIDGVSGRDISNTFGLPRQQEVVYLPSTKIEIKKVMVANDGNPLIFAQEVASNENIRPKETGNTVNHRPTTSVPQNLDGQGINLAGNGPTVYGVSGEAQSGNGRDVLLSERGTSAEAGNVLVENGGINNVHTGVLDRKGDTNNGGLQSEPVQETETDSNSEKESKELSQNVADKNGTAVQTAERETPTEKSNDSGSNHDGVGESDDSNGDSGSGTRGNDNVNEIKSRDFTITKAVAEDIDTKAPSIDDNINAIKVLQELETSGKMPTKAQQAILAKFKGWGGLTSSFWRERTRLKEIMSDEEISAAQSTVNDAYFTPTGIIDSVYKALAHLGFEGGNILEPSMGVGNFFGRLPKSIKDNSSLFGVEIDTISGRIAQHLYPSAKIEVSPFQDVAYKDGAFDLIVGNVPFGEVKYKYKNNKYLIHDYFFVKAMDKLADGGILAFLTSRGTLDKLDVRTRQELNRQGNIIAAYRLPSSVFTKSAGASPVTDLIIMQKSANTNGEKFVNIGSVEIDGENFSINEYFVNNPQNIIGELTYKRNWRTNTYELDVAATGNVAEQLTKAIRKLPKNLLNGTQTVGNVDVTENTAPMQTFTVTESGDVEYIDAQTGEIKQITNRNATIAKEYINLKGTYQSLIDSTLNEEGTSVVEGKRKELNTLYDSFVKKYGTLEKNKRLLSADNDFVKLSGLEVYDTKKKKIIKSEMFSKDTLGKRKPKKADSALDALSISIGESGGVNLARISELTGLSEAEAVKQLEDRIVFTPDGTYELNEVYLSGNVREKYNAVKGKKGFEKNERMLKDVIPEDIPAKNITPQFGSPWIKPEYISQFLSQTLNLYSTPTVSYDPTTGTWSISSDSWGDHTLMTQKYGTKYMDAIKIAEKAINMRRIVIKNKDGVVLVGETRAAQQKAEDIKTAFEEWCFKDAERRQDLVKTFNEKFNSHRNMDFSELAKYLTFDGLTESFELRGYQKRAVARAVFNGNTLLAHGVGTGKTAEMIAIAMELKRMGIAKKNMMVVPNHKVADFRNDILKMYPSAKVIMLEKGANASQRQRYYAQVAANDWDIVIIPHSSFGMLDVSEDTKTAFVSNQIAELEEVLINAQLQKGKIDNRFIRTLEKQKKTLEEKLKQITESAKDIGNTFEELGVDSLFVDEAHNFKNLPFYSKLSRVAGVSINQPNNKTRASRAENMFMITDYLNRNNGRITFGTATPITNSMSEIYNMMRFLRPDILQDAGIQSFDAWASMFGSIVNQAEVDPSGRKFRMKERFSKFKNVAQMVEQFRRMADILKTGDVIQELPEVERIDVINESNEMQEEFLDIIDKMIDEIRTSGQNAKHNMLEVTTAGQMAAVDLRFVESYFEGKYTKEDLNLPNNRISRVAENVVKEYKNSNSTKGTQFIFCDVGINDDPTKKYNLHVYGDLINRLVAAGIPREEIAVAQDFEDKADLSARVNTGEIRVLIGSTAVMGEGMNAQQKAIALHHMTVPHRPSDIEQREGRIIRFGNENKNVRIYRYIQEKSYDSYQWQMQERKASFINQALSGGTVEELEEMSDFQLTAREAKAIASGNPLLLEKIEIEDKLNKLKSLRNKFNTDKLEMKDRLATLPSRIKQLETSIANMQADLETINANDTKDFEITFGKTKYTERAKAAEALDKAISKAPRNGTRTLVGSYKGLELYYSSSIGKGTQYILKGSTEYVIDAGESSLGNITRVVNRLEKLPTNIQSSTAMLENYKSEIETIKNEVSAEFPKAKELDELQTKLNDIDTQLGINVSEVDMSDVVVGEDDDGDSDSMIDIEDTAEDRWTTTRVGDNKKPKSISEIIATIEHDFGLNVTTGHVRGKGVLGKYEVKSHGIRTKIANNLPVVSHELGHYFERTFGIKEQLTEEMHEELSSHLDEKLAEKYSEQQLIREGVAEYVRHFLKNRETAAIDYPLFTEFFLKCFNPKDLAKFEQLADDINAYYSLDADTATSSIRLKEEGDIDLRTPAEKLQDTASHLYQAWVDSNHAIKRFDKATGSNAYILASNAAYSDAIAGQIITSDLTDQDGKYVTAGLKTVLNGINLKDKEEYRLFGEYLVVKHGPERLREGMRVFADDRKNSTNFMERRQADLEAQYPQFAEVSERLYNFIKKFYETWGVKTGLISQETLENWGNRWEFYVPFNRAVGKKQSRIGAKRGFANQNSTIKRAKGGGQDIYNPVDNLVDNIVKMVNAGVRNNVMLTLTKSASKLGAEATFLEKVPMPLSVTEMDMTGVKEKLTDWLEESDLDDKSKEKAEGVVNNLDDILLQYGRGKPNKNVVTVLVDGEPQAWKINDVDLLRSLTSLSPKTMDGILDAVAVFTRFVTSNITGNNIVWSIFSNSPRDAGTFFTYSKNKNILKMVEGVGSAYLNKIKGNKADPLYKEFLAMGGGKTSAYTADRDLTKKARKKFAGIKSKNPIDYIAFVSDTIEAGPRFATYKMMREAGMSPQEAFYEAMDITTNFRRGGHFARELNKIVPFFNASVQGLDKFRRWITAEELSGTARKKAIRNRTIAFVTISISLAAINYALNNSDEEKEKEYEQLSTYTKNSYWNIPIGDGKYFAIPKPREIGVLSSFFERCLEYGIGENDHTFDEFYAYASENFLPPIANDLAQVPTKGWKESLANGIGSFVGLGAVSYIIANRDFLGRPIVSSGLQNLEPKDQYTERTSKIAYWLGQAFNGSPQEIDFFAQQILGGWWKGQKALFPVGGAKDADWTLGVGNTYIKDNQYSLDLTNWLYDRADTTEKSKNSDPTNTEKAIAAKWDSNMTEFYGTYYKKAKDKTNSTAARSTRQLVLDMIYEYQKGIDGNYKTQWQEAVENVCNEKGSTVYLPSVMSAEVTDGDGKKHNLSDVQYVEYQTDYLRLYWETIEDTLPDAKTTAEKSRIILAAKEVAREQATERTLNRIGAPSSEFATKYEGVDNDDLTVYLAGISEANSDNSVKKEEVVNVISEMDLDNDDAWTLYLSKYDSKTALEAEKHGINAELFMTATVDLATIKPDYRNGKAVSGSRRAKVERYLNSVCNSYKEYLFLLGSEFESVKKDPDYIHYFGK